jgi:hypothetical protein
MIVDRMSMTFRTNEATALKKDTYKKIRGWKRTRDSIWMLFCLESRVLKDISSTHHIVQNAEKKIVYIVNVDITDE